MSRCVNCRELAGEWIDFCNKLLLGVNLWFQKRELLVPAKSKIHRNHMVQFQFLFLAKHIQLKSRLGMRDPIQTQEKV